MSSTRVTQHVNAPRADVYRSLPSGVPAAANEAGWREALAELAVLVER